MAIILISVIEDSPGLKPVIGSKRILALQDSLETIIEISLTNPARQQYRMHAAISAFPSFHFYEGRLQNDDSVCCRSPGLLQSPVEAKSASMLFWDFGPAESAPALGAQAGPRSSGDHTLLLGAWAAPAERILPQSKQIQQYKEI